MSNPEMMRAFSADPSNKLPGRPKGEKRADKSGAKVTPNRNGMKRTALAKGSAPKRTKGVKRESIKQVYRRGVLNGIRLERFDKQKDDGHPFLFHCEYPGCEWGTDDIEEAKRVLHLHHAETQRSLGPRATPENVGVDDPGGLWLLCPPHHEGEHEEEDAPKWTKREAS